MNFTGGKISPAPRRAREEVENEGPFQAQSLALILYFLSESDWVGIRHCNQRSDQRHVDAVDALAHKPENW